jgi:hypothetical protein
LETAAIPAPGTFALLGTGLVGLGIFNRQRRVRIGRRPI